MSESCNHQCSGCESNCAEQEKIDFLQRSHELSNIKKVIGVVSGKGGVGKSLVTSLLAVLMQKKGFSVAILDADITGPSIPKTFGIDEKVMGNEIGLFPARSKNGINVMSINLLLQNDTDPVVWRGPVISGIVKQFWSEVIWGDVDYMFVDLPPGTGDVALTVFQSLPVDGIVIVTSPQKLVSIIVEKAVNMAKIMNIPVLGLVENMSYLECPDCGKKLPIFGTSTLEDAANSYGISVKDKIPVTPALASLCDEGSIELFEDNLLSNIVSALIKLTSKENKKIKIAVTYENENVFQHFGHTKEFKVYSVENKSIVEMKVFSVGESGHCALSELLLSWGVSVLICGGIGAGAKTTLSQAGIEFYGGVTGNADEQVKAYLDGNLKYNPDMECDHHDHSHGDCGEHDGHCNHEHIVTSV